MEQITAMLILVLLIFIMRVEIVYPAKQSQPIVPLEKRVNKHTATAIQWLNAKRPDMKPTNAQWREMIAQLLNDENLILDQMNPGDAERVRGLLEAAMMGYVMSNVKESVYVND